MNLENNMNEVRIYLYLSRTATSTELHYEVSLSDEDLNQKIEELKADGMSYRIVDMYDGQILFSNLK